MRCKRVWEEVEVFSETREQFLELDTHPCF